MEAETQENGYITMEWEDFLSGLDRKHRTVVILYYVQGFKTREIAEILRVNESTVRSRLAAARDKMERLYERSSVVSSRKFVKKSIG